MLEGKVKGDAVHAYTKLMLPRNRFQAGGRRLAGVREELEPGYRKGESRAAKRGKIRRGCCCNEEATRKGGIVTGGVPVGGCNWGVPVDGLELVVKKKP